MASLFTDHDELSKSLSLVAAQFAKKATQSYKEYKKDADNHMDAITKIAAVPTIKDLNSVFPRFNPEDVYNFVFKTAHKYMSALSDPPLHPEAFREVCCNYIDMCKFEGDFWEGLLARSLQKEVDIEDRHKKNKAFIKEKELLEKAWRASDVGSAKEASDLARLKDFTQKIYDTKLAEGIPFARIKEELDGYIHFIVEELLVVTAPLSKPSENVFVYAENKKNNNKKPA